MRWRVALAILVLVAVSSRAHADALRLADVQVTAVGADAHRIRLRSTGPQPFDVVRAHGRKMVVRLHGTRLAQLEAVKKPSFARLRLVQRGHDVIVRVKLVGPYVVRARQGDAANVVDLLVVREAGR